MSITLSGHQLKSLLEFVNPDGEKDLDQLDNELTIKFLKMATVEKAITFG